MCFWMSSSSYSNSRAPQSGVPQKTWRQYCYITLRIQIAQDPKSPKQPGSIYRRGAPGLGLGLRVYAQRSFLSWVRVCGFRLRVYGVGFSSGLGVFSAIHVLGSDCLKKLPTGG